MEELSTLTESMFNVFEVMNVSASGAPLPRIYMHSTGGGGSGGNDVTARPWPLKQYYCAVMHMRPRP